MTGNDNVFTGSIPELYDTHVVPLIFQAYADDLAERVSNLSPQMVLEVAAGSGVVTRSLAPRLASDAHYTVTDLNQPMLDRAVEMQPHDDRITWHVADAQVLPFDDRSFDVVVCQFGAMYFPDKVAAYSEIRRVLKPTGKFIFNTWDNIESNEFPNVVEQTLAMIIPDNPPQFFSRSPYSYHDKSQICRDLESAGFSQPTIDTVVNTSSAPNARQVAFAMFMGSPVRNEVEELNPDLLDDALDQITEAIATRFGDGPTTGKISGHVVYASK